MHLFAKKQGYGFFRASVEQRIPAPLEAAGFFLENMTT